MLNNWPKEGKGTTLVNHHSLHRGMFCWDRVAIEHRVVQSLPLFSGIGWTVGIAYTRWNVLGYFQSV